MLVKNFKSIIKLLLPPIFFNFILKLLQRRNVFRGEFSNWENAKYFSKGYQNKKLLQKIISSNRICLNNPNLFERDSIIFNNPQYAFALNACLLFIISKNKTNKINILDFGGALGTSFRQFQKFTNNTIDLTWTIIEQEELYKIGIQEFSTEKLIFSTYYLLDNLNINYHALIFSSVLEFLNNPYEILLSDKFLNINFLLLDRTPVWLGEDDIITNLIASKQITGSYPCTIFSYNKLTSFLKSNNWILFTEWNAIGEEIHINNKNGKYIGQLWKKN